MKYRKFIDTLALVVLTVGILAVASADAQTTAVGPYYAWPSWDQTLPSSTRFIVLSNFNNQAVLDRETGLVWERSPALPKDSWFNSLDACANLNLGGRKGWRLPSVHELASLVDTTAAGSPVLPAGHPFLNVQGIRYWSASVRTLASGTVLPWAVDFSNGFVDASGSGVFVGGVFFGLIESGRWCVRGGQSASRDY